MAQSWMGCVCICVFESSKEKKLLRELRKLTGLTQDIAGHSLYIYIAIPAVLVTYEILSCLIVCCTCEEHELPVYVYSYKSCHSMYSRMLLRML